MSDITSAKILALSTSGRDPDASWPVALALLGLGVWASRRAANDNDSRKAA